MRVVIVTQVLSERNCTNKNDLRDNDFEEGQLNVEKLSNDEWLYQQYRKLKKNEAENITQWCNKVQ